MHVQAEGVWAEEFALRLDVEVSLQVCGGLLDEFIERLLLAGFIVRVAQSTPQ